MATEKTAPAKKSSGLDPKLAALLSWLFAPIASIVFMVLDDTKGDAFVQFNAKESLYYSLVTIVLAFGFVVSIIPFVGWIIACLVWLAEVALLIGRIVIAVKAYNGDKVVLPVIGPMSEK